MIKKHYGPDNRVILEYCCDFCNFSTTRNEEPTKLTPIMECDTCSRHACKRHRIINRVPEPDDMRLYCIECYCSECWETGHKNRDCDNKHSERSKEFGTQVAQ
jgi:hypothetical protein